MHVWTLLPPHYQSPGLTEGYKGCRTGVGHMLIGDILERSAQKFHLISCVHLLCMSVNIYSCTEK